MTCASQALLLFSCDTWQSAQPFVSFARTVCGTKVLNACALKPSAEIGLLLVVTPVAVAFCELTSTAQAERTGATR